MREGTIVEDPGSDAAIKKGCTCPVVDNHHGNGFMWQGKKSWWIAENCPLHGWEEGHIKGKQ